MLHLSCKALPQGALRDADLVFFDGGQVEHGRQGVDHRLGVAAQVEFESNV